MGDTPMPSEQYNRKDSNMREDLKHYRVEPEPFWQALPMLGVDGYSVMGLAEQRQWHAIGGWGREHGYNLGSWPLVMIFFRDREASYDLLYYVEGDTVMYACPTEEIRNALTDTFAFFHWKHQGESWVEDYDSVEQLPDALRGPYRAA